MQPHVYWILVAIALVVVELLSGTFYLVVLGLAAFGGAALAFFGLAFSLQAGFAAAVAAVGVAIVHRYRVRGAGAMLAASNSIDVGQRVTLESWIDEAEGTARVRYRDTLWDARVIGERPQGAVYYIRAVDGSTLHIAAA